MVYSGFKLLCIFRKKWSGDFCVSDHHVLVLRNKIHPTVRSLICIMLWLPTVQKSMLAAGYESKPLTWVSLNPPIWLKDTPRTQRNSWLPFRFFGLVNRQPLHPGMCYVFAFYLVKNKWRMLAFSLLFFPKQERLNCLWMDPGLRTGCHDWQPF